MILVTNTGQLSTNRSKRLKRGLSNYGLGPTFELRGHAHFSSPCTILCVLGVNVNMARGSFSTPNAMQAPDSPRSSESPVPQGIQGDLEQELLGLANALYNLGTTVVSDLTKERDKPGGGGKQVGMRV